MKLIIAVLIGAFIYLLYSTIKYKLQKNATIRKMEFLTCYQVSTEWENEKVYLSWSDDKAEYKTLSGYDSVDSALTELLAGKCVVKRIFL